MCNSNATFQQYKENNAKVEDKGELIQDAVENVGRMFRRKTIAVRVIIQISVFFVFRAHFVFFVIHSALQTKRNS